MDRRAFIVAGAALLSLGAGWLSAEEQAPPVEDPWSKASLTKRFPDPDTKAAKDDFVGNFECQECHEDRWKSLGTSFHAELIAKGSKSRGCESCHGPGRVHYDDAGDGPIRHPQKVDPVASNATCLRCHQDVLAKPVRGHREWTFPQGTEAKPRACVHCHSIHVDRKAPEFAEVGPFATVAALDAKADPIPAKTCVGCHADFHPDMKRSGHKALLVEGKTCGACHGEGSLHARSGGDRRKIVYPARQKPKASDATCNTCHQKGEHLARWTCSEHSREGISCITCHDANARVGRTLRASEFELCGDCHLDVRAKLRQRNRHLVKEGRVTCSDCHDPHGNTSKLRDQDLRMRVCLDCHREKGGPFVYDHGIKRTDGCVVCHDPHGSPNRRMLTHTRIKPLCLQCHPDSPHNLSQRKYDNCIACHIEIHGSDADRLYRR